MKESIGEISVLVVAAMLALVWFWAARPPSAGPAPKKPAFAEQRRAQAVKKPVRAASGRRKKSGEPKTIFGPDEEARLKRWYDDVTNMTWTALTNNDVDALEEFAEFLREKDDWTKAKALADAMFLVKDWRSAVPEDAQDCVLDVLSEYAPDTLPEMVRLLDSAYDDVREDALGDIADAIEESEDEKGACSLISTLSDTVDDAEFAERMVEHLDMMDLTHDVSNAMMHILSKGTPAFKKALSDFLVEGEYADGNDKTALAYGVGRWLSEKLAEED